MNNMENKLAELEALLFIHGEPLTFKKIQAVLDIKPAELDDLIGEFRKRLDSESSGLSLLSDTEKIQLVTKPQFGKILEKFVKEELSEDLSPASLETLAIVSYFAPISRAKIEYLRGVNSSFILRSLLLRGLVERYQDPDRMNAFLYRLTFDLLKHFGVGKQESLPDFEKYKDLLKKFEENEERIKTESVSSDKEPGALAENAPPAVASADSEPKET